ncbi:MAG: response regulator transcription factor [Nitrospira sp.]|nr:response regulator transcription factor [Nitrospira sp.]
MPHQPPSILVGDDHAMVRRGLRQIVAETCAGARVEEAGTGQAVIDAVRRQAWTVVILDINLPDKNGLEVLKDVKALRPSLPVLILSHHPEEQYAARVYKAGASGYLTKDSAPDELELALRKVLAGGRYVSPSFAERLAGHLTGEPAAAPHEALSDREHLVLCEIARGKPVSQIADDLALSVKTVSTYRARLLEKLQLANNAALMRYALDHRLVE